VAIPPYAHRYHHQKCKARYGIATGRTERDVTADLRGALPSHVKGHFAAITEPKPLGQLLRDIDLYGGNFVV
jgi:hypothetical protein